jgi:FkbM family methyltransferase
MGFIRRWITGGLEEEVRILRAQQRRFRSDDLPAIRAEFADAQRSASLELRSEAAAAIESLRAELHAGIDHNRSLLNGHSADLKAAVLAEIQSHRQALDRAIADVDSLRAQLASSRDQAQALRNVVMNGRRVGFIDFGEIRAFMFADDMAYQAVDDRFRRPAPPPTGLPDPNALAAHPLSIPAIYENPSEPLVKLLMAHHWLNDLDFTWLDIGCQYGVSSIASMREILKCGRRNRVVAFDPGLAGLLVPSNLELNGMQDLIAYERCAVSNRTGPTILFSELGHTENNRVVNRSLSEEVQSYVIPCVTVDAYVARHALGPRLIVKVDTQGAEFEVFQGMRESIAQGLVTSLTEFTPHALISRVNPAQWLAGLIHDFEVFDIADTEIYLGPGRRLHPVEAPAIEAFVAAVRERPSGYTDLLLLPRALPGLDDLRKRISTEGSS